MHEAGHLADGQIRNNDGNLCVHCFLFGQQAEEEPNAKVVKFFLFVTNGV